MLVLFCHLQDQNFQYPYCKVNSLPPKLSTKCTGRPTYLEGIVQDNNKVDDSLYKVLGRQNAKEGLYSVLSCWCCFEPLALVAR